MYHSCLSHSHNRPERRGAVDAAAAAVQAAAEDKEKLRKEREEAQKKVDEHSVFVTNVDCELCREKREKAEKTQKERWGWGWGCVGRANANLWQRSSRNVRTRTQSALTPRSFSNTSSLAERSIVLPSCATSSRASPRASRTSNSARRTGRRTR